MISNFVRSNLTDPSHPTAYNHNVPPPRKPCTICAVYASAKEAATSSSQWPILSIAGTIHPERRDHQDSRYTVTADRQHMHEQNCISVQCPTSRRSMRRLQVCRCAAEVRRSYPTFNSSVFGEVHITLLGVPPNPYHHSTYSCLPPRSPHQRDSIDECHHCDRYVYFFSSRPSLTSVTHTGRYSGGAATTDTVDPLTGPEPQRLVSGGNDRPFNISHRSLSQRRTNSHHLSRLRNQNSNQKMKKHRRRTCRWTTNLHHTRTTTTSSPQLGPNPSNR